MRRRTTQGVLVFSCLAVCVALTLNLTLSLAQGQDESRVQDHGADSERVVQVVAQRFHYMPEEIVLKAGEPVRLEFTALDFTHGFNIPDLKIRADLVPGRLTVVRITPQKAGVYDFQCDNFCGNSHEEMNGRIVVND